MVKKQEETVEVKPLNVFQKINVIMKEIDTVYKTDKKVNGQYRFVTHNDVAKLLHEPLTRVGVHMVPSVTQSSQEGNRTSCTVQLAFFNVDDPSDVIVMNTFGTGIDSQDKGAGKAFSYAVKTGLLKMFMLESSEEDNEASLVDFNDGKGAKANTTKAPAKTEKKKSFVAPSDSNW